jgi:CheY-like chemotaxis protein
VTENGSDTKRILLADDEPLIRVLTRKTLAGQDFSILEATDGEEALRMAREHHPDLIVLDVRMPGMSGIEVCRTLRQEAATRTTPIILLAGDPGALDQADGVLAGANHFFTKPFSPLELIRKIKEFLQPGTEPPNPEVPKLPPVAAKPPAPVPDVSPRSDPIRPDVHRSEVTQSDPNLADKDRELLLLYATDLSAVYREEQRKREELNVALETVRDLEKMKDIFVSLVSHELRTPLSIIKGYVSLMDQILTTVSQGGELQRFTMSIQRAADRLEELIKELLDFSKMKHGMVPMEKQEVHLPTLVAHLVQELSPYAASKDIHQGRSGAVTRSLHARGQERRGLYHARWIRIYRFRR